MRCPLYHVDVFTTERFFGNPLAVVLDADDVDPALMQRIAREMNLSETTFVQRSGDERASFRVRIFTPGQELPFAGHPTIGTAFVLDRIGLLASPSFAFEMRAGIIPVTQEHGRYWMTPPLAQALGSAFDRARVAEALELPSSACARPPQRFGGSGIAFLCILLDGAQSVDRARIRRDALVRATDPEAGTGNVLLFAYRDGAAHSRMFANIGFGVGEDPATGSSVAPLVSALSAWHAIDANAKTLTVEQGTLMGRRSLLHVRFTIEQGHPHSIAVGGSCVPVYESVLEL
jgi:trans-2,3-dihydro-3-hydroxyanthranilate isomerase